MAERACPIALQARLNPSAVALETDEREWSYAQLDGAVHQLLLHLKTIGIGKGSRVAFLARNEPMTIFLFFALFRSLAIACPLSFRAPQEQIPNLLQRLEATHFLSCETLPYSSEKASSDAFVQEEALATFMFTSGSSAIPKIACHTLGNHLYNALGAIPFLSLELCSRYLLSLPLFHVGGLAILFRTFLSAATLILSKKPLSRLKLSHLSLVPTQLYRLQNEISENTHLLIGGAPLSSAIHNQALERGLHLTTSYGMTEMSSLIHADSTLLPFRELCLQDNEIHVRGKTLFSGYLNEGQLLLKEGWFATRDLGSFRADGSLHITGRKDRLFICGGENIQPEEIERALCTLPGILFARVIPIPDPEFGHRPIAYIHDASKQYTLENLREHLAPLLPSFKHPIQLLPYSENSAKLASPLSL
jgi:o-succinylbenzoate---CoA ligase